MTRLLRSLLLAAGLAGVSAGFASAEIAVPYLSSRVVDLAEMISPAGEQALEAELAQLEKDKGAQVAVLTVPSLEGEPIESFALRVAEAWKLGQQKQDNGAILVIARADRQMRIEVGYGLEGAIPDVIAKRILSERLTPRFQAGDFDGGVAEAVSTLDGLVRGEPDALPEESSSSGGGMNLFVVLFVGFVVFNILLPILLSAVHSKIFGWVVYPLVALPAYLVPAVLLSPFWGVVGLVGWLVLFPVLRMFSAHLPKPGVGSGGGWSSGGGGWSSGGGGWSSRGGGWSGGGGGFSGGGGSFGGGGASGNW